MFEPKIFEYDLTRLTLWKQNVIAKLQEIGKLIHEIWLKQIDPLTGKAVFYDTVLSKNDVLNAAKSNPEILSPYTLVRVLDGQITAVPYREEYSTEIEKIVELLYEAGALSEDPELKNYLTRLGKAFDKGNFDEALIAYLENDNTEIEVLMGPIETYVDKLLGSKKAFQFNLRVMSEEATSRSSEYLNIIKQTDVLKPVKSAANYVTSDKVKIRVDNVLMFTGRQAGTSSMATNLPNEAENVKKYGTKVVLYQNSIEYKYKNLMKPFLNYFANKEIVNRSDEELIEGIVMGVALHEITEAVVKFDDARERLREYHDAVMELNSELLGVKSAQYHLLKGMITERQYENILLEMLMDGLDKSKRAQTDGSLEEYAKGYQLLFNYAQQHGGIKIEAYKMTIDFKKLAQTVSTLASINLEIFQEGDAQSVSEIYAKYNGSQIIEALKLEE